MTKRSTGMVLGKFMPPHLGHVYLGEFAERYVDDLSIVVGTLASEPIPGRLRYEWMRELFPRSRVIHLEDENPQDPADNPDFWAIWKASLLRALPVRPDFVFASEGYGSKLADVLGAEFVVVDPLRAARPISGTAIRRDPLAHWEYLPRCVRPHFVRRVCVFGPESTGKTTLAERLRDHFRTVMVPEYARTWLENKNGQISLADIPRIARGQIAAEDALAREANRLLIADTDILSTVIWSETLFQTCPEWIRQAAMKRAYDLYLLLDVDVPWVADPVRYLPKARTSFFARCKEALESQKRPHVVLRGSWDERFEMARAAVETRLL